MDCYADISAFNPVELLVPVPVVPNEAFVDYMIHVLSLIMQPTHVIKITPYQLPSLVPTEVLLRIDKKRESISEQIVSVPRNRAYKQRPPLVPPKPANFDECLVHAYNLWHRLVNI